MEEKAGTMEKDKERAEEERKTAEEKSKTRARKVVKEIGDATAKQNRKRKQGSFFRQIKLKQTNFPSLHR